MGARYAVTVQRSPAFRALLAAVALLAGCRGAAADGRANAAPPREGAASPGAGGAASSARGAAAGGADFNPCGGQGLLVTFTVASFDGVIATDTAKALPRLRLLTDRVLAPVRDRVTRVEYSPVLRTTRLALADSASVRVVVASLSRSPEVGEVSLDACALKVQARPNR